MFDRLKSFIGRMSRKAKCCTALMSAAVGTAIMSVAASAEGEATGSTDIGSIITSAGNTLKSEFTTLVSTLVPVLIGIAVVGLGLYACIYLFRMAKKFFSKAAG